MLAKEAAMRLGLSTRTLLDYQHKGVITVLRDRHGRWNYTEAHIEAILAHMAGTRKKQHRRTEVDHAV